MMAYLQTSPKMEAFYEDYVAYLREEKHCSPNTLSAYQRDMQKFFDYAEEFGIASFDGVEASDVSSYKQYLLRRGLSASSPGVTASRRARGESSGTRTPQDSRTGSRRIW